MFFEKSNEPIIIQRYLPEVKNGDCRVVLIDGKIGGAIKIIDGNNRAVPPIAMQIFANFKMLSSKESEQLSHWKKKAL